MFVFVLALSGVSAWWISSRLILGPTPANRSDGLNDSASGKVALNAVPATRDEDWRTDAMTGDGQYGIGGPEEDEPPASVSTPSPTPAPVRRQQIVTYTVQSGDTVWDIAQKFGISPDTIIWANEELEDDPDYLYIGQELIILPVSGVYHTVRKGETIEAIAKKYQADPAAVRALPANKLEPPRPIVFGEKLIVPGGRKPVAPKVVSVYRGPIPEGAAKGTGEFAWPTSGWITQRFWLQHQGIDIGAQRGTPVVAADSGFVVFTGYERRGFGNYIVIDHGNGYQTLYAHLDTIAVKAGSSVAKGETIGSVGNTGRSTGSHLDFRIRGDGVWQDPLKYLKPEFRTSPSG